MTVAGEVWLGIRQVAQRKLAWASMIRLDGSAAPAVGFEARPACVPNIQEPAGSALESVNGVMMMWKQPCYTHSVKGICKRWRSRTALFQSLLAIAAHDWCKCECGREY